MPDRGGDGHRVDLVVGEELVDVGATLGGGVLAAEAVEPFGVPIAERGELRGWASRNVAREVGTPVAEADDPDTQH